MAYLQHSAQQFLNDLYYADCRIVLFVTLNVIMLSVIMPGVVRMSVVAPSGFLCGFYQTTFTSLFEILW